ncbi:NUDIX hydrolase [Pseudonocardia nigra]|uniref:NUDIX hydrolase n=1 Tax=Pseudonocardia nigra TaxID=1921578 RepID=UPI0027E2BDBA|nr:NUDIX hydrolase [Pseudonocardia nigra]
MTTTTPPGVDAVDADVLAAGAVLWRRGSGGPELALVHRPRYDDWSFPKGKLDPGESMPFAAVREIAEETGHPARLGAVLGDVRYAVPEGRKVVRYWAAEARTGTFTAGDETDELRWLDPGRAAELLSYEHDLAVLERFTAIGAPRSVVALVRHAKAGSRSQWDGDDDLRPLSGTGREQAHQLAALLPLFGPDRIVSAPPVRCRDTVAPLAGVLGGLPVADEPLLGENGYWVDPAAGRACLRTLAAQPGVTVVCSQGGVIPDVIAALATGAGLPGVDPEDVHSRKGSTWLLTFDDDGTPRSADYYPHPTG